MKVTGISGRALITACGLLLAGTLLSAQSASMSKSKDSGSKTVSSKTSGKAKSRSRKGRKKSRKASWRRGQQKPDAERTSEIQHALIREHYLDGEPTGVWDQKSQRAMERYQADNGWQTKTTPDARALIKLGLGPNHDHLLNPESAMTSPMEPPKTSVRTVSGSPAATVEPATSTVQPQH